MDARPPRARRATANSADSNDMASSGASLRTVSGTHGTRLTCFRARQRFSLRPTCRTATDGVCACACEPLQCRVLVASESSYAEPNSAALRNADLVRRKKWADRFESHDWEKYTASVCQRWRDYQTKLPPSKPKTALAESAVVVEALDCAVLGEETEASQRTSASRVVKNALTTFASAAEMLVQTAKFDGLLRAGVPPHLRGQVWWLCSGAADKREAATDVETYDALVRKMPLLSKRAAMEIEKDLPRTFPTNDLEEKLTRDEKKVRAATMNELRRVLQAYCLRNPSIGYCQSMNFLAAVLLQYLDEEEAFWVLVAMVEELIPQFHSKSMVGSRAEQRVFSELVQLKLPQVYQHMQSLGVDLEPFTLKWFLCLFLNTLPLEPVMRVWDVFFCEGSHVLLRVGLTLLKLSQPRILACDDPIDVYEMFQFTHESLLQMTAPYRAGLLNRDECVCDTLIRLALDKSSFLGTIAFDALHELRHLYRNEVADEVRAADARRALRRPPQQHDDDEEEDEVTFHLRHAEAERELQEYDFIEEYTYHCGDVSPTKHIRFGEVRGGSSSATSSSSEEIFVDVDYACFTDAPSARARVV